MGNYYLSLVPPAEPVLVNAQGQAAGLRLDTHTYRMVYLPFNLNNLAQSVGRPLIESSLDFLLPQGIPPERPTTVEEGAIVPIHFSLSPNYPNPFNPTKTNRDSLPQAGEAELSIYNLLGQRVATLVRGPQGAGPQVLQWNGRDDQDHELASGVYLYRLQAGAHVETRKLLLLR